MQTVDFALAHSTSSTSFVQPVTSRQQRAVDEWIGGSRLVRRYLLLQVLLLDHLQGKVLSELVAATFKWLPGAVNSPQWSCNYSSRHE